jgi:peroxiredoxin
MRSDIIPGVVFLDYELSDHTAKRRKLSELQGQHPMVLVLSRRAKTVGGPNCWFSCIVSSKLLLLQAGYDQH